MKNKFLNKLLSVSLCAAIVGSTAVSLEAVMPDSGIVTSAANEIIEVSEIKLSKNELEIPENCTAYIYMQSYENDYPNFFSDGSTWDGGLNCLVLPANASNKELVWTTNNSDVAKVENGHIIAVGSGSAIITATSTNGVTANCTVTVPKTTISFNKTQLTLTEGETAVFHLSKPKESTSFYYNIQYLIANLSPSLTGERTVTLESDNEDVVKIDGDNIIAVSHGKANVTAKLKNGNSAVCEVTVPETKISFDKSEMSVKKGQLIRLSIPPINGSTTAIEPCIRVNFSPVNAQNRNITWNTDNPKVLTLGDSGFTANTSGTATITAKLSNGNESSCEVTVISDVTGISLNKESATIKVGDTLKLIPLIEPDDATDKSVVWTSSDNKIAEVDNGIVKAKNRGFVIITAKSSIGMNVYCSVLVEDVVPKSITLNHTQLKLKKGETSKLTVTTEPQNVTDNTTEWLSLDEGIATINNGVVKAVAPGTTNIIVSTSNGKLASCKITVEDLVLLNTSVINSDKVQIGDKVRIAAAGNGGTAPYKYAYYYKRSTNAAWKTLGTEWGTNSSVAFTPTAEASYDIKVIVKDSTGTTAEKLFTVTAVKELELTNVSVVGRINIKLGTAIPMIGKAVGGAGEPYTYSFYFKRSTNTAWKLLGDKFTATASARFKPTATGTYDIRIDVKDNTGTIVKKFFTATVK